MTQLILLVLSLSAPQLISSSALSSSTSKLLGPDGECLAFLLPIPQPWKNSGPMSPTISQPFGPRVHNRRLRLGNPSIAPPALTGLGCRWMRKSGADGIDGEGLNGRRLKNSNPEPRSSESERLRGLGTEKFRLSEDEDLRGSRTESVRNSGANGLKGSGPIRMRSLDSQARRSSGSEGRRSSERERGGWKCSGAEGMRNDSQGPRGLGAEEVRTRRDSDQLQRLRCLADEIKEGKASMAGLVEELKNLENRRLDTEEYRVIGETAVQAARVVRGAKRGRKPAKATRGGRSTVPPITKQDMNVLVNLTGRLRGGSKNKLRYAKHMLRSMALLSTGGVEGLRDEATQVIAGIEAEGLVGDKDLFKIYIDVLAAEATWGKAGIEDVQEVLLLMQERNLSPDYDVFLGLMRLLTSASSFSKAKPEDALWLLDLHEVLADEQAVDVLTFNSAMQLVRICAEKQRAVEKDFFEIFNYMRAQGVDPDLVTYNTALIGLAQASTSVQRGLSILDEMTSSGVAPDLITFNTLMQLIMNSNWKDASVMLRDVLKVKNALNKFGLKPDTITYNILLKAASLAKKGGAKVKIEHVQKWLREMESSGVMLTTSTLNSVMTLASAMCAAGDLSGKQVNRILDFLVTSRGVRPDIRTYNLLLSSIAGSVRNGKGSMSDAGAVLEMMDKEGRALNVFSFNSLLQILAQSAAKSSETVEIGDLESILTRMEADTVRPDTVSLNSALSAILALSKAGKASSKDADVLLDRLTALGVRPDAITYSRRLELLSLDASHGKGSYSEALMLLQSMREDRIKPNLVTLNILLRLVSNLIARGSAGMKEADEVMEFIREEKFTPTEHTVSAYCKCARLARKRAKRGHTGLPNEEAVYKAWALFKELEAERRTDRLYANMMDAFGSIGKESIAVGLIELAESHGVNSTTVMYNAALRCCRNVESFEAVLQRMRNANIDENEATQGLIDRARGGSDLTKNFDFYR